MSHKKHYIILFSGFLLWILFYLTVLSLNKKYNFLLLPLNDVKFYNNFAREFLSGKIPFVQFSLEYPPASIIPFFIPALFSSNFETYKKLFAYMNILLCFGTVLCSYKISRILRLKFSEGIAIFCLFLFGIFIPLVITRFDMFIVFLTTLGMYLYLLGLEKQKYFLRSLTYILLMIGGFAKLYPFVIIPVLFLFELKRKEYPLIKKNILVCFVSSIPFVAILSWGYEGSKIFLQYHAERGLEIESTYASLLLFLHQINFIKNIQIGFVHETFEISGKLATFSSSISVPIFIILYSLFLLLLWKRKWANTSKLTISILLSILIFVLSNKVFSTQYFLWFFPFLAIFPFLTHKYTRLFLFTSIMIASFITVYIYPFKWEEFAQGNLLLTSLLLLRNLFLLSICFLCYQFIKKK